MSFSNRDIYEAGSSFAWLCLGKLKRTRCWHYYYYYYLYLFSSFYYLSCLIFSSIMHRNALISDRSVSDGLTQGVEGPSRPGMTLRITRVVGRSIILFWYQNWYFKRWRLTAFTFLICISKWLVDKKNPPNLCGDIICKRTSLAYLSHWASTRQISGGSWWCFFITSHLGIVGHPAFWGWSYLWTLSGLKSKHRWFRVIGKTRQL